MPTRKSQKKAKPKVVTPEVLDAVVDEEDLESIEPDEAELSGQLPAVQDKAEQASVDLETLDIPGAHQNLLKQYMAEVGKYPLLPIEEELSLARKLRETGDLDAARQLVRANLRLVVKIAMEYRSAYQNVLDLIQEGNVGLMKAVSKFDPTKGAKLSYYAGWWIRSYILKYILDNFRLVRVGTTQAQKKLFFHLMREKERLEAQGLDAGPKLLADRLHVREQDVVEMETRLSGRGAEMSLDTPLDSGDSEGTGRTTHLDLLAHRGSSPDDELAQDELKNILTSRLDAFAKTLKDRELAVFQERLSAEVPKTLQEVADQFGLTRERARQIEAQVIQKLRAYYKKYM